MGDGQDVGVSEGVELPLLDAVGIFVGEGVFIDV